MEFATIEIDFEVHKKIEVERASFGEKPNDALRRLLGLGPSAVTTAPPSGASASAMLGRSWVGKNVELPHGTLLRMRHNNRAYDGVIHDGEWLVDGHRYSSPSGAAGGVAITRAGTRTKLDGWTYWTARKPGSPDFIPMNTLWEMANR